MNDQTTPSVEIFTISPVLAREWLELAGRNRRLDLNRVREYSQQMTDGFWGLTGDAITFDIHGRLVNGQHRLHACIKADCSFRSTVLQRVEEEVFKYTDQGKTRNPATILHLDGIKDSTSIAPMVRVVIKIELCEGGNRPFSFSGRQSKVLINDILGFAHAHIKLLTEASYAVKRPAIARPKSLWGALYFHIVNRGRDVGRDFMHKVLTGEGTGPGDPAYAVRERTIRQNFDKRAARSGPITADYVIHGWNAHLRGRSLTRSTEGKGIFPIIGKAQVV